MGIDFAKFFRDLFGKKTVTPPVVIPVVLPFVFFYVRDSQDMGIAGATVTLTLDDGSPPTALLTDANGLVSYQTTVIGVGVNVTIEAPHYLTFSERRLIPMETSYGPLPEWPTVSVLTTSKPALPPIPTRAQVCALNVSMQGLRYHTAQYGDMPGAFFWAQYEDYKTSVFPAHRAVGDTHMMVPISCAYREPGTLWPDVITNGEDLAYDLPKFKARLREVICEGFFPEIPLAGDAHSIRKDGSIIKQGEYNGPIGNGYGYEWLLQNLARILKAVRGDADSECPDGEDLTVYCLWVPGFDGVF